MDFTLSQRSLDEVHVGPDAVLGEPGRGFACVARRARAELASAPA